MVPVMRIGSMMPNVPFVTTICPRVSIHIPRLAVANVIGFVGARIQVFAIESAL